MRIWVSSLCAAALGLAAFSACAEERASVSGKVADPEGKPVEHATVMVYAAGVRKGYSEFCPTCWADCGKRTATDAGGAYSISGLNPDLVFTLLVLRDGYSAQYVKKVDPAEGAAPLVTLKTRPAVEDTSQVVRGKVVDVHGEPVRDAVVEQAGVSTNGPRGITTRFGGADGWIDEMAVSNQSGEFELAYGQPAVRMILRVNPRGMAPSLYTEPTGPDRKILTVRDGAVIRGRLVANGKPVANAEVGLITHERRSGTTYAELLVGTKEDGTFTFTSVPAGRIWMVYPKMESVADRGVGGSAVPVETKDDGEEVNVGDIQLVPGHTIKGKVVLSDGKAIPPDMRVSLGADLAWDTQMGTIARDGSFELHGVVDGVYSISPAVRGYRLGDGFGVEILVKKDIDHLVLKMDPAPPRQ